MTSEIDLGSGQTRSVVTVLKWAMTPVAPRSTSKQQITNERVPGQRSRHATAVLRVEAVPGSHTGIT